MTSITIPDGVTSIGDGIFHGCSNLTSIGDYAFSNCDLLTDVYYNGSEGEWETILSATGSGLPSNTTIHYNSTGPVVPDVSTISVSIRVSDGKPKITWSAVENATGYEVYRSSGNDYVLLNTADADRLHCTHSGAKAGTEYSYKVIAICGTNTECNSSYSVVTTITAQ